MGTWQIRIINSRFTGMGVVKSQHHAQTVERACFCGSGEYELLFLPGILRKTRYIQTEPLGYTAHATGMEVKVRLPLDSTLTPFANTGHIMDYQAENISLIPPAFKILI